MGVSRHVSAKRNEDTSVRPLRGSLLQWRPLLVQDLPLKPERNVIARAGSQRACNSYPIDLARHR